MAILCAVLRRAGYRQFAGEEKVSASLVKEFRGLVETYFAPPAQAEVKSSLADVMARRGMRVVS